MGIENMTTMWLEQLGNPDCSMLAGMFMGNLFTYQYITMICGLMVLYKIVGHLIDIGFKYVKEWYKKRRNK